jgi:DNA mismatch endonuclease (patch repair protein)
MADMHSKEVRSYNMSRVKGKNTGPEILVRKFLHANGFRYKLHEKKLPGKPDIVLPKYKTVILINGCFWHGHKNCKYFTVPKTRTEWWLKKIGSNILNDKKIKKKLREKNWQIIVLWTCQLKRNKIINTLNRLQGKILRK